MPISAFTAIATTDNLDTGRIKINSQVETLRTAHNSLETTVNNNSSTLSSNTAAISSNTTAIQSNSDDILAQSALIANNSTDITTNSSNINALENRTISTVNSITGGGNLTANRTLKLVNDVAAPGPEKVYGTNGSGVRGWYDISSNLVANNIERAITQTSHGFSIGNLVQHNGSIYTLASSNTEADSEVVGIVTGVTDADNFIITYGGYVSGLTGLTAGTTYFLDGSGALSATGGTISKPIFIATSTTEGVFFNFRGAVEDDLIAGEFTYNNTGIVINSGADSDISFPITYNRLFGVSVSLTGLTAGQTATVSFYGDAARTDLQYSANFTDSITVVDSESWRYRSRALDKTAYIRISNTSGSQVTVTLDIVAEPF